MNYPKSWMYVRVLVTLVNSEWNSNWFSLNVGFFVQKSRRQHACRQPWAGFVLLRGPSGEIGPDTVHTLAFSFSRELENIAKNSRKFQKSWDKFCWMSKIKASLVKLAFGFLDQLEKIKCI